MDGQTVGFALWFSTFSTFRGQPGLYLEDLFVKPECRSRGIGKALLAAVAAQALERGCGRLEWSVLNWNTAAAGFYRSLGARPLDEYTVYRIDDARTAAAGGDGDRTVVASFLAGNQTMNDERISMTRFFLPHIAQDGRVCAGRAAARGGFIKLNTNENPYPPSPRVKAALLEAINDRLRLYPDPVATAFCQAVARLHGVSAEMVMAGNGSDDLLTIITRAFVGPGDAGRLSLAELPALFHAGRASERPLDRRPLRERLEPRPRRGRDPGPESLLARQPG